MKNEINLNDTKPVKCGKCQGETFFQSFMLRKISKFLAGSLQDQLIPIQVFNCSSCNSIVEELLPEELKTAKYEDVTDKELPERPEFPKGKLILG